MSAYMPSQLHTYLTHISFPRKHLPRGPHPGAGTFPLPSSHQTIDFLTALHIHHISTIPYENLSLHYSPTHHIDIEAQHLFEKIVNGGTGEDDEGEGKNGVGSRAKGRGRGGYCMENALFFWNVLKGLGFDARLAGVRIRQRIVGVPTGDYTGCTHVVNVVTLPNGDDYMLDVSFGGDGPTKPLPLIPNLVHHNNIGTQEIRLIHEEDPFTTPEAPSTTSEIPQHKFWIYQYRNDPSTTATDGGWNSFYAFSDAYEFRPLDLRILNWYTSTHPDSFQTFIMLVVKFLRRPKRGGSAEDDEDEDEEEEEQNKEERYGYDDRDYEIYGKRILVNNVVKENLGGKTRVVQVCETEAERIAALEKWFGIFLTTGQKEGIRGWSTEIKAE